MDNLSPYIISGFLGLSLFFGIHKPKLLIYLYAFSIPFYGALVDVGLQINPEKVVGLIVLPFFLKRITSIKYYKLLVFYIVFSIFITVILSINLPDYADKFPLMRGRLRWLLQIVVLLQTFIPVLYFPFLIKSREQIMVALKFFLYSSIIAAVLGLIQLLTYISTGIDILPMFGQRTAAMSFAGFNILRISSYSGEPKHLALCLVFALTPIFISYILNLGVIKHVLYYIIILIIAIFFTSSTQGLVLLGLLLLIIPILSIYLQRKITKRVFTITLGMYFSIFLLLSQPFLNELLLNRTVTRLEEKENEDAQFGGVEDFDQAILGYVSDNPQTLILGLGLGNIHLYAYPYIPKIYEYYMYESVFYSKKGFLRQLTEVGIIGFLIFLSLFINPLSGILKRLRANDKVGVLVSAVAIMSLFIYLNTCDGPNFCPFALILLYSYQNILKKERSLHYSKIPANN